MKRVFSLPDVTHGAGQTIFFCWQKKCSNYLVTTGYDNCLNVFDRHGEKVASVNLTGFCSGLSWDSEGNLLAIITNGSPTVILWDAATHKPTRLDTGVRDTLTILVWSKSSPILAVGTSKGNLLIYDHDNQRKIPVLGKHTKKITAGAWSEGNLLALISEDKTLSVSNKEGDTVCQTGLKHDGSLPQFSCLKPEGKGSASNAENCVSLILNRKIMFILNIHESEIPYMFAFQERYGQIVDYQWFGDGLILVGFNLGTFIVISTQTKEMGQEITNFRAHKESLSAFTLCPKTKKMASCSENTVKIFDMTGDNEGEVEEVLTLDDEKAIVWMEWTDEGQMLAVASPNGSLHVYLAKLAVVGGACGTRLAFLSSLLEVSVISAADDGDSGCVLRLDVEPSIIAVGPYHVVAAMNNRAWFYALTGIDQHLLWKEKEYVGIIKDMKLNSDYAAALFTDGRLYLHIMESNDGGSINDTMDNREVKIFPDGQLSSKGKITAMALTADFLIFATDTGAVEFFMLEDWAVVNIYRHSVGVRLIESDPMGLRVVGVDEHNNAFVYNAVTDLVIDVPGDNFPNSTKCLLWENFVMDKGVFVACDTKNAFVYCFLDEHIEGLKVEYVGNNKIPTGQFPKLLYNGVMVCQTQSGKTSNFILSTHEFSERTNDQVHLRETILPNILKLRRYQDAWRICEFLNEYDPWVTFGKSAMGDMELEMAVRVFRNVSDPGMVMSLQSIKDIEERALLAGHLSVFLGRYDLAQELFLSSTSPQEALRMRQHMQDWDTALVLAKRLAPHLIPFIAREYASQLEFAGDYHSALEHFERGVVEDQRRSDPEEILEQDERVVEHNIQCRSGIARNSIRCGNAKRGLDYALALDSKELSLECAEIMESMKLFSDAAVLYEKAHNYEKAALFYLRVKNASKVDDFLEHIDNKNILIEYAKAKEFDHKYRDAMKAYSKAQEHIQVVRILLDELNNPGEAVRIVKELKSVEGAKMVAQFFQKLNDMSSAIEFLVLSKCNEEAFQLASSTGQMDIYSNVLLAIVEENGHEIPISDFHSIALFYEQDKNALMAGKFYCLSENYRKGVKLLLSSASVSSANESEAIRLVIDAASKCKEEQVMRQVIDYLIGETDGMPKDFKYLFRLYMSLGHYREAAKTAVIIAREEQAAGNYRNSHDLLFGMAQELQKQKIKIPSEMNSSLMLIHSYLLAKVWIKMDDHPKGALLLIRVAKNISRFPAHTVAILTSTVVECQRAGFRKHSIQFAMTLMKPEYRDLIDSKFKKKIETLVRKSAGVRREGDTNGNAQETNGSLSPCPFCGKELPETELNCNGCKNTIPFCVATGHHLIREDLAFCPKCSFPAILTHFLALLESEHSCPMCSQAVDVNELVPATPDEVNAILTLDSS